MGLLLHQPAVVVVLVVPMAAASVHDQDQRLAFSNNSNSTRLRAQVSSEEGQRAAAVWKDLSAPARVRTLAVVWASSHRRRCINDELDRAVPLG